MIKISAVVLFLCLPGVVFPGARDLSRKTVVIDPGHGGYETGVLGVDGRHEKDVNLALARLVSARLEGSCRVLLTRNGDYYLDNRTRVSRANQVQADLYISLHVAAGWSQEREAVVIRYSQKPPANGNRDMPAQEALPDRVFPEFFFDWDRVHHKHYPASRNAAGIIREYLVDVADQRGRLAEARLDVLAGADMPAVMIETGPLSSLAADSVGGDGSPLRQLAHALAAAVERVLAGLE